MEVEAESLDELFSGETPEETEVVETEETGEQESTDVETKDDSTPESKESKDDSEDETKDDPWHLKAVLDERDKRQKAQQRAEELERKLAELSKTPDEEKRPDVFEDQDGAFKHLESKIENARLQDRMDMSREFMSMLKDDYEEREAEFLEMAKGDTTLVQKLRESRNPAKFAYDTAVKHEQLKKMENLDEWRDQQRAEIRAELLKELEQEKEQGERKEAEKRESITPSLAKGRSKGGNESPDDESLTDILGD